MLCSNNVSILHNFEDITTSAVHVTPVTLKSPSFTTKQLKLQVT